MAEVDRCSPNKGVKPRRLPEAWSGSKVSTETAPNPEIHPKLGTLSGSQEQVLKRIANPSGQDKGGKGLSLYFCALGLQLLGKGLSSLHPSLL